MPSPDSTRPLRGAVLGLGTVGVVAEAALASARGGATVAVEVAI